MGIPNREERQKEIERIVGLQPGTLAREDKKRAMLAQEADQRHARLAAFDAAEREEAIRRAVARLVRQAPVIRW